MSAATMSYVEQNGLFSSSIRAMLGMSEVPKKEVTFSPTNEAEKEKDKITLKNDSFQRDLLKMNKEQISLLRKIVNVKENISKKTLDTTLAVFVADALSKTAIIKNMNNSFEKLSSNLKSSLGSLTLDKSSYRFATTQNKVGISRFNAGNNRFGFRGFGLGNSIRSLGRPITEGVGNTVTNGLSTISSVAGGALGGGLLAKMASATNGLSVGGLAKVGGKVVSKVALPLAALMAGYEGIKGGFDADNILGRKTTLMEKFDTGLASAADGLLLGLPTMVTKYFGGESFAKTFAESSSELRDQIGSSLKDGFLLAKDKFFSFGEAIASSLPSKEEITNYFSGMKDRALTNFSYYTSKATDFAKSSFDEATTMAGGAYSKAKTGLLNWSDDVISFFKGEINKKPIPQRLDDVNDGNIEVAKTLKEFMDEEKKKNEGLFSWLKGAAFSFFGNSNTNDSSNSSGSIPNSGSGGSTVYNKSSPVTSGSTASGNSIASVTQPVVNSFVGKDAKGNDVTIPLPTDAGRLSSNAFGRFIDSSDRPTFSGNFLDPKSNPNVNPDILKKYEGRNLPVVIRNNNPAALSLMKPGSGEFAEKQPGYVGATPRPANEGGFYAKYATPEHGIAANAKLLERYGEKGINTPDAIVRKWSTNSNAWGAYSKRLQDALGVSGDTPLDLNDKEIQKKILMAKSAHESGTGKAIYNEETFKRGVNREFPVSTNNPKLEANKSGSALANGEGANLAYNLEGKTRDKKLDPTLEDNLKKTVGEVYGKDYRVEVYSGGQNALGEGGKRTGSTRHDNGGAADVYIYDKNGKRLVGDELNPLAQAWATKKLGGVGLGMANGGIHLDKHTDRTPSWSYTGATDAQRSLVDAIRKGTVKEPEYKGKTGDTAVVSENKESKYDIIKNSDSFLGKVLREKEKMTGNFGDMQGFDDSKPINTINKPKDAYDLYEENKNKARLSTDQPVSPTVKTPEIDYNDSNTSTNLGNGGFTDSAPAPTPATPTVAPAPAPAEVFSATPTIDNELALLSVNSTTFS